MKTLNMRSMPFESPAQAEATSPRPFNLTLRGRPGGAEYPPLCPHCGNAAAGKLDYAKVFVRSDDDTTRHIVTRVSVPFCGPCIEAHHREEVKPSALQTLWTSFSSMHMLGAVFPAMAAVFVLHIVLGDLLHGNLPRATIELGIAAVFALIAYLQARAVWEMSEYLRVLPQTSVTRAFDFSDDASTAFEPERFNCTIENGRFANAFRALNIEREWLAQSAQTVAERRRANIYLWAFGAFLVVFGIWELIGDIFN
jgi:hypothetical protein